MATGQYLNNFASVGKIEDLIKPSGDLFMSSVELKLYSSSVGQSYTSGHFTNTLHVHSSLFTDAKK